MTPRSNRSVTEHGRYSAVKMSKATQVALHGLCYMGSVNEVRPIQVSEIINGSEVSESYTQRIMHQLSRQGIVVTHRGVNGGYSLGRKLSQITLFEIVDCLEGPISQWIGRSSGGRRLMAPGALALIEQTHGQILDFLRNTTLDTMLRK